MTWRLARRAWYVARYVVRGAWRGMWRTVRVYDLICFREAEEDPYKPNSKSKNRMLLWHGSRYASATLISKRKLFSAQIYFLILLFYFLLTDWPILLEYWVRGCVLHHQRRQPLVICLEKEVWLFSYRDSLWTPINSSFKYISPIWLLKGNYPAYMIFVPLLKYLFSANYCHTSAKNSTVSIFLIFLIFFTPSPFLMRANWYD